MVLPFVAALANALQFNVNLFKLFANWDGVTLAQFEE